MVLQDAVRLNIGGRTFLTRKETLRRLPGTRLAELDVDDPTYLEDTQEYYFDRNAVLFEHILDYYRTGELHFPHCLCGSFVQQELHFWGLDDLFISDCCQRTYRQFEEERRRMDEVEAELFRPTQLLQQEMLTRGRHIPHTGATPPLAARLSATWLRYQSAAWCFLEYPTSGIGAKVWAIFFLSFVILSAFQQCVSTHPAFRVPTDAVRKNIENLTNPKEIMYNSTDIHPFLWYLEILCMIIFTAELLVRFVVSPHKVAFFKSGYNLIDIISVVTMLSAEVITGLFPNFWADETLFNVVYFLTLLGIFRILRLLKFARHYYAMRVMLLALRKSMREMLLLVLIIGIGMLIFSNLIYFAEFQTNDFESIPVGFWWSIVTMTTVGYGDTKPTTGWGYLIGSVCALCGMLSTGLPIPIIASNFNIYYSCAKTYIHKTTKEESIRRLQRPMLKNILKQSSKETRNITNASCTAMDAAVSLDVNVTINGHATGTSHVASNDTVGDNSRPGEDTGEQATKGRDARSFSLAWPRSPPVSQESNSAIESRETPQIVTAEKLL